MELIEDLKNIKCGKIKTDVYLKDYTTYKLGGTAKVVVYPSSTLEIINLLDYIKVNNVKYKVIGNGSNVIFTTDFYDGILIKLSLLNNLSIEDTKVVVGAGYNIMKLAYKVSRLGLTGLEFATGIPGTVGGSVYMNAGAYKSDMGYVVSEIKVLTPNLEIETIYNKELDFHYRTSLLQHKPGYICIEATIILKPGNVNSIMELISERKSRRLMTQPLEYPSAGSVFRNPENDFAGRLIEELGFKGKVYDGVEVSAKHANFIINRTLASGNKIKELIELIQKDVKDKYNVELVTEQEYID